MYICIVIYNVHMLRVYIYIYIYIHIYVYTQRVYTCALLALWQGRRVGGLRILGLEGTKQIFQPVFLSGGVSFSQTPVWQPCF